MAISITKQAIVWNTTAGNKTTASFTPPANALLVVLTLHSAVDADSTITDSESGSWGKRGSTFSYSTAQAGTLQCFTRTTGVTGGSMTVTTAPGGTSTGGGLIVYSVTGQKGYGAIPVGGTGGQADQASGGTPAPVLSATPLSTDGIIAWMADNTNGSANSAARSSPAYTEDYDQGYNTPASGIESQHVNSGETTATITFGATAPSQFGSYAISLQIPVNTNVVPGLATLTTTTFTPTVTTTNNVKVTPGLATLSLTAYAPTVSAPRLVTPGIGTLTLTTFTPSVIKGTVIVPGLATLALTPYTPDVTVSGSIAGQPIVVRMQGVFGMRTIGVGF